MNCGAGLAGRRTTACCAEDASCAEDTSREIRRGDAASKDSFPASDPPATQGPDEPPANAEAKWKAAGVSRKKSIRRSTPASSK